MSRLTNAINPNDLLARHLIDIAKGNRTGEAFVKGGNLLASCGVSDVTLSLAVSTFGKFPEENILSIHSRILTHLSMTSQNGHARRGSNHSPPRVLGGNGAAGNGDSRMNGMEHDDSDTLAAEPKRKGGLMRSGGDVRAARTSRSASR